MPSATLPRRSFLKLAGAGGLALGAFPHLATAQAKDAAATGLKPTQQPSAFVQIAPNGEVTVTINRLEFGQGVQTGLPMILAEELDADWSLVRSRNGSSDAAYLDPLFGIHLTGGSHSIKNSFTQYRELGARARAMLLSAAAARWNVDVATLRTQAGTVLGPDGRKAGYGELAEAAMALPVPEKVTLKNPKDFRIIGQPTTRLDARAKSSGRQDFGIDTRLPGQLTAVVAHPPVFGARLASVDDSAARAIKGVKAVLRMPVDRGGEGVAVVADGYWPAKQGRDALKLQWDTASVEKVDSERLLAQYRELAGQPGPRAFDADMAPLATAPRQLEAEFVFPYLAHAPMEPLNCTVQLSDGRAELWVGTQCPGLDAAAAAGVLGLKPEQVTMHVQMAGGGFGRRFVGTSDYVVEACAVAKAARAAGLNAPVRTLWSREDDIKGGYYRPMHLHRARIGFDERGNVLAWDHVIVGQSILTGTVFEQFQVKNGIDATATEGMREPYARADAPDRAPPEGQRAGAVVAQRGFHPHRLRDGDPARRDRPRHEAGPGGLPHAAVRRQAPAPQRRAATGGGQERLWQEAAAHRPRLGRGGARVLRLGGGLRGGSLGAGRPAGAASGDRRRALQPGRQPAQRGSAGAGRGADGPVDVPAGRGHHAEGRRGRAEQLRRLRRAAHHRHAADRGAHRAQRRAAHRHGRARPAAAGTGVRQRHCAADRQAAARAALQDCLNDLDVSMASRSSAPITH